MKHVNNKIKLLLVFFISSLGYILSCTHDNSFPPPPATTAVVITHGTNIHLAGLTAGNVNEWKLDKTHSSTLWSTNYVGAAGLLTGRFNQFGMHEVTNDKKINYNTTGQPLKDSSFFNQVIVVFNKSKQRCIDFIHSPHFYNSTLCTSTSLIGTFDSLFSFITSFQFSL